LTSVINERRRIPDPAVVSKPASKLIRSSVESVSRVVTEKALVVNAVDVSPLKRYSDDLTKPPSLSRGMRKAGIALIATPDPFTGVPGVALLASSFIMKRKEPASLGSLAQETRKVLREIQSLTL